MTQLQCKIYYLNIKGSFMKKIILGLSIIFLTSGLSAKTISTEGISLGMECEDYCYLGFKTKNQELWLSSSSEQQVKFAEANKGKIVKITYDEKMVFIPEAGQKVARLTLIKLSK